VRAWSREQVLQWCATRFGADSFERQVLGEVDASYVRAGLLLATRHAREVADVKPLRLALAILRVAAALRHECNGKPFEEWSAVELSDFVFGCMPEGVRSLFEDALQELQKEILSPRELVEAVGTRAAGRYQTNLSQILFAARPPTAVEALQPVVSLSGLLVGRSVRELANLVRSIAAARISK
jgi:hypothetical protein